MVSMEVGRDVLEYLRVTGAECTAECSDERSGPVHA
jgi:hypothetical protein